MNSFPLIAIAMTLVAMTSAQDALTADMCLGTCKKSCEVANQACVLVPGLNTQCAASKASCEGLCDLACNCVTGCINRCAGDATDCGANGNLISPILCRSVQAACVSTCGPSCGFDVGSAVLSSVFKIITPK